MTYLKMSVSDPTSFEAFTCTGNELNLRIMVECLDPSTRTTPTEPNSSCSYFVYPVEYATSLQNETMSYMFTKYPPLRERIQSL